MPQFCKEQQLPLLDAPDLPIFHRFIELERPAQVRLTAARSRADLLVRLWPGAAPHHPLVRTVLRDLLERQKEAPLLPRPFWELRDFLDRPFVRALRGIDAEFASTVDGVLSSELLRRLSPSEIDVTDDLTAWLRVEPDPHIRVALRMALTDWLRTVPAKGVREERAAAFLAEAARSDDVDLLEDILKLFEAARRSALLERAVMMAGALRSALCKMAVAASQHLSDPGLAAFAWGLLGDRLEGLREATRIALAQSEPGPALIEPIVRAAEASERLTWALEVAAPELVDAAASLGGAAAAELGIAWPDLVERCREAPNGLGVLAARALSLPSHEVREALERAGPLAPELLKRALHGAGNGATSLILAATDVLPNRLLLSLDMAVELDAAGASHGARCFAEAVAPRLVGLLAAGQWSQGGAAAWLGARPIQQIIERSSAGALFSYAGAAARGDAWLPNIARAIHEYAASKEKPVTAWIPALLERPLDEASAGSLAAAEEDLLSILELPMRVQAREQLSAMVLQTMRQTQHRRGGHRLVERTFPVVYPRILEDKDWPWRSMVSSWRDGWDLAKAWRHWLLDTWLAADWPPEGLLRCFEGDEHLLRRIAHRAMKGWEGRELLRRLRKNIAQRGKLATDWERRAARILHDMEI
jgi:hypothetical protein